MQYKFPSRKSVKSKACSCKLWCSNQAPLLSMESSPQWQPYPFSSHFLPGRHREMWNSLKSFVSDQRKFSQCKLGRDCQRLRSSPLSIIYCKGVRVNFPGCRWVWRQQPGQTLLASPPTAGQCWQGGEAAWRQHSLTILGWWLCAVQDLLPLSVACRPHSCPLKCKWALLKSYLSFMNTQQRTKHTEACCLYSTFPLPWCSEEVFSCFLIIFTSQNRYPVINMQETKLQNNSMISLSLLGELAGDGKTAQLSQ